MIDDLRQGRPREVLERWIAAVLNLVAEQRLVSLLVVDLALDVIAVERVAARIPVGNLYVNRHITGAMVGRQPFGGNRLSGIGAKAGGPGYLLQFVEPRVVSENTMRHGLVV